jgi:hypothetical protein
MWNPKNNKITESRNVKFVESVMYGDRHRERNGSSDNEIFEVENQEMSQLLLVENEGFLLPSEIERLDDFKEYLIAMKSEEASLKENNVYEIVPRPVV